MSDHGCGFDKFVHATGHRNGQVLDSIDFIVKAFGTSAAFVGIQSEINAIMVEAQTAQRESDFWSYQAIQRGDDVRVENTQGL